jgi:ligand-binding sensor domain-containing protein/DNA-binding CsgD family transcriptional regulator
MKKVFFFFFLLLAPLFLFASVEPFIRFERIIPELNAISIPVVSSILQDKEGFLWLGTDQGLVRYDGYHFTRFSPPQSDQEISFWSLSVFPMIEDRQGDIWFGTNGYGLFRFSRKDEEFTQFKHEPENPASLCGDIVISLQQDKNGDLYIGTRSSGLCRYEKQNKKFTKISLGENVETIWELLIDTRHHIWIGTQNYGLFQLDFHTQKLQHYAHNPEDPTSIGSDSIWSVFEGKQETIWVGTKNGGLNQFDGETKGFTAYLGNELGSNNLRYSTINSLWEDETGKIWVGTSGNGLRIFDQKTKKFVAYKHQPNDPDSLSDNSINAIYQDSSGIMWIATQRGGINKSLNNQVKFNHFKHNPINPQSISDNHVRCIYQDQSGFLWIGTSQGLDRIDEKNSQTTHFIHNPDDDTSISEGPVQAVIEDDEGMIWVGMDQTGLDRFDPGTGNFSHFQKTKDSRNSLSHNKVNVIHQDEKDKDILWIGTQNGLNQFSKKTNHFTHCFSSPKDPSKLSSSHITTIMQDRSGDIWIGTVWGLNRMDKKTESFTRLTTESADSRNDTIVDNHITSLLEDKNGVIWIGTFGGISKYDRARDKWEYYTIREGLPGDIICGLLEDETGCLWVSSNRGLLKFDPQTESITTYTLHDGIQSLQFNIGAFFKTREGQMVFGGVNGYNRFDPKDVHNNPFIPPIAWTGFYVHNEKHNLGQPLSSLKEISLYKRIGFITFEFAALCFVNPERNQFAFKLEGRDKEWIYTGPNRTISFPNLSKGEYILHVKAANPDGVWNEKGLSILIKMIPPFWKTWWFMALALSVISLFILSWMRTRRKLKDAQTVKKENLEKVFKKYIITQREQEIIKMILDGASNKDIEKKLFISSSTVRNHIYNIYQKLGIQNRIELINLIKKQS